MSLRRNVLANYAGQAWTGVMGIAFIPIYIRILGIEAYGLIGIFAILQGAMALLDTGMTSTFNREMARYSAGVRSLEIDTGPAALARICLFRLRCPACRHRLASRALAGGALAERRAYPASDDRPQPDHDGGGRCIEDL